MRRPGLAVLVLAAAGALAACHDSDRAAPPPERSDGLAVSVGRSRLFEAGRDFELSLTNNGTRPVEVDAMQLRSDQFEELPPEDRALTLSPNGLPVTMPLPYGSARCDASGHEMRVGLTVDAQPEEVALGPASADIERVHDMECAARRVEEAVEIGFGPTWSSAGPANVAGTITFDVLGDAKVRLEEVDASVVLTVEVVDPLPAADDVDVVITAARCDAHALTESKKTFKLPALVSLDGKQVRLELDAGSGPVRGALDRAIEECVAARLAGG